MKIKASGIATSTSSNLVQYIRITFDHRISLACRLLRT